MSVRRWEPIDDGPGKRRWLVPVIAVSLLAFSFPIVVLDPFEWRLSTIAAQRVADDPFRSEDQHAHAILTLQRTCIDSIASLRELAKRADATGARARHAISNIRQSTE